MKPPETMPMPWQVGLCYSHGFEVDFEYEGKFKSLSGLTMKDQEQAIAYIQHCVNNYPALVEALEKLAKLGNGDQYGNSNGNVIAQDALRKAGEL